MSFLVQKSTVMPSSVASNASASVPPLPAATPRVRESFTAQVWSQATTSVFTSLAKMRTKFRHLKGHFYMRAKQKV